MKALKVTTRFKKDLKRIRYDARKIASLQAVLDMLRSGEDLPPSYYPHELTGNYKGYLECHVENDLLLIWIDEQQNSITLVRLGTHSELFG